MPTDLTDPIIWNCVTLEQAIDDEDFEFPQNADRYVTEAQEWEEKEKVNGKT